MFSSIKGKTAAVCLLLVVLLLTGCEVWEENPEVQQAVQDFWAALQRGDLEEAETRLLPEPSTPAVWDEAALPVRAILKETFSSTDLRAVQVLSRDAEQIQHQVRGVRTARITLRMPDISPYQLQSLIRWTSNQLYPAKLAGVPAQNFGRLVASRTRGLLIEQKAKDVRYEADVQLHGTRWVLAPPALPEEYAEQLMLLNCTVSRHMKQAASLSGSRMPTESDSHANPAHEGQTVWETAVPGNHYPASSTQTTRGLVVNTQKKLVLLDESSGDKRWSHQLPGKRDFKDQLLLNSHEDSLVYAINCPEADCAPSVVGIDLKTGETMWQRDLLDSSSWQIKDMELTCGKVWVSLRRSPDSEASASTQHTGLALSTDSGKIMYRYCKRLHQSCTYVYLYDSAERQIIRRSIPAGEVVFRQKLPHSEEEMLTPHFFQPAGGILLFTAVHRREDHLPRYRTYALHANSGEVVWEANGTVMDAAGETGVSLLAEGQKVTLRRNEDGELMAKQPAADVIKGGVVNNTAFALEGNRLHLFSLQDDVSYRYVDHPGLRVHTTDNQLYVTGEEMIRCINTETGQVAWSIDPPADSVLSISALTENRVLLKTGRPVDHLPGEEKPFWSGYYLADSTDGTILGKISTARRMTNREPYGGSVLFYTSQQLLALDLQSGDISWTHPLGQGGLSGEAILELGADETSGLLTAAYGRSAAAISYRPYRITDEELLFEQPQSTVVDPQTGSPLFLTDAGIPLLLTERRLLLMHPGPDRDTTFELVGPR